MKTIIKKILPLALVAILFTGCAKDFLDVDQKGVRTIATFYKTDADATSAIASWPIRKPPNIFGDSAITGTKPGVAAVCSSRT